MKDVLVPEGWSQVAVDILAQKYFRKAGVPQKTEHSARARRAEWLQRGKPAAGTALTQETDARQVFRRLAGCWTYWGWKGGYFSSEADARTFYDETCYMLAAQMAAPNSPQWFNTGLHWAYGIEGPPQGHYYVDPATREMTRSTSAYERPAPHACFIQSINDDLVNEGGIMDLWVREARIFKYGSGTGTQFLHPARRRRTALRRRQVERPDELPQDRRPRRRRHQVGRHHPPRRQDGRARSRSSGHRGVHQLEGRRGAEGRRPGDRLAAAQPAPQRDPEGLPRLAAAPQRDEFDANASTKPRT